MLICCCSLAGSEACKSCEAYIREYGLTVGEGVTPLTVGDGVIPLTVGPPETWSRPTYTYEIRQSLAALSEKDLERIIDWYIDLDPAFVDEEDDELADKINDILDWMEE